MVTLPLSYVKGVFTAITIWKKQGNEMKNTWLFDSLIVFRLLLLRDTNSYFLSAFFTPRINLQGRENKGNYRSFKNFLIIYLL